MPIKHIHILAKRKTVYRFLTESKYPHLNKVTPLPPPMSGKKLVEMLDQFTLTPEDVEELERLIFTGTRGEDFSK